MLATRPITYYLDALLRVFIQTPDKREAHQKSRPILKEISHYPGFLTDVLARYLATPGNLSRKHYPVVALPVVSNPYFDLVINCWIPLPDRNTDTSTKAIHHHGSMLLSTTTLFGPGYEHWAFGRPEVVDPARELYSIKLLAREPHPLHHTAFVDAYLAHLPLYPADLTLTLALWSNSRPTSWKDHVKRIPLLQRNAAFLRKVAARAGLARALDLKIVEYFDFYPTKEGFRGMRERVEFSLGPNKDYLQSLCYILQKTGNERLVPLVRERLEREVPRESQAALREWLSSLERGLPVEGKLSECHLNVPHATFTRSDIEQALAARQ